ncbi:hypothetical protein KW792_00210 [Candidatus Saccharibacteria bacterium]|nr:hypothetical protein [Candidatus Saccharibacteria bacterium]
MKKIAIFTSLIVVLAGVVFAMPLVRASDCDSNAVIRCGVSSNADLQSGYQQTGTAAIYNYFGISATEVASMYSEAVNGTVTNSGSVLVGSKVVARDAMTAGRQNMSGSTAVTRGGTTFYVRPPSVSFQSSSLAALVVMRDNRFSYAVIKSCGNPVMAIPVVTTPVVKKTVPKTVTKTVTKTVVVPPAVVNTSVSTPAPTQTQEQTQTQTVYVTPSVQAATTAAAPVVPVAKALPKTGPGSNVLGISGTITALGTVGHYYFKRRQLK